MMLDRLITVLLEADGAPLKARALIAYALIGTLCVGFLRGTVEAELFVPIAFAAAAFYFATRAVLNGTSAALREIAALTQAVEKRPDA